MSQLSLADQKADKSRVTAYPSITFPKFPFGAESRRRFEEARKQATRALEDAAIRRAKEGTAKPVLHKGKQVYVDGEPLYEHQYSDALLMFLLRAYDREKFGDRQVIELKLEDWDGDLSKLSEQSAKRLLGQIEAKISPAGGLCAKSAQAERTLAELWPASGSRSSRQLALLLA